MEIPQDRRIGRTSKMLADVMSRALDIKHVAGVTVVVAHSGIRSKDLFSFVLKALCALQVDTHTLRNIIRITRGEEEVSRIYFESVITMADYSPDKWRGIADIEFFYDHYLGRREW